MKKPLGLLVAVGCASRQLPIRTVDETANIDAAADANHVDATCAPSRRIRVTDAAGRPVRGAAVVVRLRVHASCPSVAPMTMLYSTDPVHTDEDGVATTCSPETFLRDRDRFCPAHDDGVNVIVVARDRSAVLVPPFAAELHAVVMPR